MEKRNIKRDFKKSYTNSKWYMQVIRIMKVHHHLLQCFIAGLGEFRIRDLNDEINKLLREKYHWEVQIFNLGGPNYRRIGPRYLDREGREVPGNRGYRYFGAARDTGNRGYRYFGAARDLPGIIFQVFSFKSCKAYSYILWWILRC